MNTEFHLLKRNSAMLLGTVLIAGIIGIPSALAQSAHGYNGFDEEYNSYDGYKKENKHGKSITHIQTANCENRQINGAASQAISTEISPTSDNFQEQSTDESTPFTKIQQPEPLELKDALNTGQFLKNEATQIQNICLNVGISQVIQQQQVAAAGAALTSDQSQAASNQAQNNVAAANTQDIDQ